MRRPTLRQTLRFISAASILTAATSTRGQVTTAGNAGRILGEPFRDFIQRLQTEPDRNKKAAIVNRLIADVEAARVPLVEDTTVHILYSGKARRVSVASDLNGWDPSADTMRRVSGTHLFFHSMHLPPASRFEYKLVVDSVWMTDPLNGMQAMGGYGPNSEVRHPGYIPPEEIHYRPDIVHGSLDTTWFRSRLLGRTHPVYVYLPAAYPGKDTRHPAIWVTDGGEYLTLGLMKNVLDNLIWDGRIEPIVGVFVDPRTDPRDAATSKRMLDYAMSDTLVDAFVHELRPVLVKKYRLSEKPSETAIMGASLGGLIATYAGLTRPDVFGVVAAQSPAYGWRNGQIMTVARQHKRSNTRFYIDTGTIRDARDASLKMKGALEQRGYDVEYAEYPEGHNWVNWRARLDDILLFFRATQDGK